MDSPLHIHVAAFLWRTRKRSGFVAIVLLLGTIGVFSEARSNIIFWLALAPLGGVIWLLFHLIGRQVEREDEEETKEAIADWQRPWGYFSMTLAEQDEALDEGLRMVRRRDRAPDPRSDAEMKEWIKGIWDASWDREERRAEERIEEEE